MAEHLKAGLGLDSTLVEGDRGEFTVWVGKDKVASKQGDEFPAPEAVARAVRTFLEKSNPTQRK